jgi:hypothetical protein
MHCISKSESDTLLAQGQMEGSEIVIDEESETESGNDEEEDESLNQGEFSIHQW